MIEYIQGEIAEITPTYAILDNNNIGYYINISLNTYGELSDKKQCKLYIHEAIREDAYVLYGFINKAERQLFLHLISVSGIGPSTARIILSSLSVPELESVIAAGDAETLKTVKKIGNKTAARL